MTFAELVATSRTCRYFKNSVHLTEGILSDLVNMAHLSPSARNLQPLRYALVVSPEARNELFPLLNMADVPLKNAPTKAGSRQGIL